MVFNAIFNDFHLYRGSKFYWCHKSLTRSFIGCQKKPHLNIEDEMDDHEAYPLNN